MAAAVLIKKNGLCSDATYVITKAIPAIINPELRFADTTGKKNRKRDSHSLDNKTPAC